ncbi:MAG: hypothetical protein ACRDEB_07970 [Chitinophagaceae bacterium]
MVQRLCCFLVVCLLIFNGKIFGQESSHFGEKNLNENSQIIKSTIYRIARIERKSSETGFSKYFITPAYKAIKVFVDGNYFGPVYKIIYLPTSATYVEDLSWICRKELQIQKAIHLPLHLRLGSLNYVDWMEQKPNAIKPK